MVMIKIKPSTTTGRMCYLRQFTQDGHLKEQRFHDVCYTLCIQSCQNIQYSHTLQMWRLLLRSRGYSCFRGERKVVNYPKTEATSHMEILKHLYQIPGGCRCMPSEPAVCGQFTIQTHCTAQQLARHLQLTQQMFDCGCGDLKTGSTKQFWTMAI